MKKTSCIILLAMSVLTLCGAEHVLVKNGKAMYNYEINTPDTPQERLAAKELTFFVQKISGAKLVPGKKGSHRIILAHLQKNKKELPSSIVKKLEKASSHEAYYIKSVGKNIYIAGKTPAGTLYGTYAFLEDILGIRFFHAGAEYIPSKKDIVFKEVDLFRQPWLGQRMLNEWKGSVAPFDLNDFHIWMTRRAYSWNDNTTARHMKDYVASGGKRFQGGRHVTFENSVPQSLFKTKPQLFPLQEGKRVCKPRSQRCLTNPEVQELLKKYILQCINKGMTFSIGYNDSTDGFCSCKECIKFGTDDKGKFSYSNYAHNFCRIMGEKVLAVNPKAELFYDIYTVFRELPTLKGFKYPKNMIGEFCPHGRCYAHTLESECNKWYNDLMLQWGKASSIGIYDYYCSANLTYCPAEYIMAKDMKLYAKRKIKYFMEDCSSIREPYPLINWQFYYVMSKIYWNADLDVEKLMDETYSLYYGKAASPMKKYHALRRTLWDSAPGHARYDGTTNKRFATCLTIPGMEERLLKLLAEAEKLAKGDKEISGRVALDRQFLTKYWITEAKKIRELSKGKKPIPVNKLDGKIVIDGRLNEQDWRNAPILTGFLNTNNKSPAVEETRARVLFDDDYFYISMECMTEHAWGALKAKATKRDSEVWKDDCVEIFITPPDNPHTYYHWIVNSKGVFYDAKERNTSFDSGAVVKTAVHKNCYVVEMKIPVSCMNRKSIQKGEAWKMHFTREARNLQPPADRESSSLDGVDSHAYLYFRKAVLGTEAARNGSFNLLEKIPEKTRKSRRITSEKLPKFWSVYGGGLHETKDGSLYLETKGSLIYTMLNLPRNDKKTRLSGYAVVSGKGTLEVYFMGCIRKKGDKRRYSNELKYVVKKLKLTEKEQIVKIQRDMEPGSMFYLEFKAAGTARVHHVVLTR